MAVCGLLRMKAVAAKANFSQPQVRLPSARSGQALICAWVRSQRNRSWVMRSVSKVSLNGSFGLPNR